MANDRSKNGPLIAIFFVGVLLLTYPILSLFDQTLLIFGTPLLYLYLFAAWGLLIGLIGFVTSSRHRQPPSDKER
jgi:hypothetical protein